MNAAVGGGNLPLLKVSRKLRWDEHLGGINPPSRSWHTTSVTWSAILRKKKGNSILDKMRERLDKARRPNEKEVAVEAKDEGTTQPK